MSTVDEDLRAISSLDQETLARRAPQLRERLNRFRVALGRHFVGKQPIIDLMVVCAIAKEPLLLVGPPGTAKSDLVLKFCDALGVRRQDAFEYMLTRFTEPSEVFGPIDIGELRGGRYLRRTEGKLPTARVAFLDEIFKSNSAILNSLLTVINERKFYQDGVAVPVALELLFAATNEVPDHAELAALRDRFTLKIPCLPVQDGHFVELVDAGLVMETTRALGQRPWAEGHATLADVLAANRHLTLQMARREEGPEGEELTDRHRFFELGLLQELRRLLKTISREDGVQVSDRRVVKLYRLLRTRAWLFHGGRVEREDLSLLAYVGDTREQLEALAEKIPKLLGT